MMSTTPKLVRSVSTRSMKKVEKPKPLKSANPLLLSSSYSLDDLVNMINNASQCIVQKNYGELGGITAVLTPKLRSYGQRIEESYKDQLDKAFVSFRNGCREEEIDFITRLNLLHLVELRAMSWHSCASTNQYYVYRGSSVEEPIDGNLSPQLVGAQPILNPGEVIKSSGKFSSPTKLPGKNYCKDEVVIRNADSGKVMGIRGRRVHMIEELSETVISFQRVSPGAKERLVQITGPDSDKIEFARQLMEDTIKRNASPVRELEKDATGSTSSLNSTASEESAKFINPTGLQDFKYSHTVHRNGKTLFLASSDLELLEESKLKLESFFNPESPTITWDRIKIPVEVEVKPISSSTPEANVAAAANHLKTTSPPPDPVKSTTAENKDSVDPAPVKVQDPPTTVAVDPVESTFKLKYEYDRIFLLECAGSSSAKAEPLDYMKILRAFPDIIRSVAQIFDTAAYLQRWDNMQLHVSNPIGEIDSD